MLRCVAARMRLEAAVLTYADVCRCLRSVATRMLRGCGLRRQESSGAGQPALLTSWCACSKKRALRNSRYDACGLKLLDTALSY